MSSQRTSTPALTAAEAVSDRRRALRRRAWRQAHRGVAHPVGKTDRISRCRWRADGRAGLPFALSSVGACRHESRRRSAAPAQHLAPYPAIGGRRDRAKSRRSRDPRQPRIHPSGGQARAPAGAANSDHRLCLAERLGLAAGPGAQDAPLCRSHPRHSALRAGSASPPWRPGLQLCRSSAGREARLDA